jgi:hypothetical protein
VLGAARRPSSGRVDEEVMRMGDPVPPMFFFRDADASTLMIVQRS